MNTSKKKEEKSKAKKDKIPKQKRIIRKLKWKEVKIDTTDNRKKLGKQKREKKLTKSV